MVAHSVPGHPSPGLPHRGTPSGSHRRARRHVARHVREEYRVARAAAVGAAGAVVVGAAFGLVGGSFSGGSNGSPPSNASLDEALADRGNQAPSRGLARAETAPTTGVTISLAQAPEARPAAEVSTGGVDSAPLPDVPESCEEYSGNQQIACSLLSEFGFGIEEMPSLVELWNHESGWNEAAVNPSSGACGIPQALPCSKMSSFGDDYQTNPATQIRWGLDYIANRYGTPTAAYSFWLNNGWY